MPEDNTIRYSRAPKLRIGWGVALLLSLTLCVVPQNAARAQSEVENLTHLVHIAADLEVDGHRVTYDEWIECRGVRVRGDTRIERRRRYIAKPSPAGGAVVLYNHPQLCFLWRNIWKPGDRSTEGLNPHFLLHIFWIDDVKAPSAIEAYYSEAYHNQPKRRVRLIRFAAKPGPYPVPAEGLRRARKQEEMDPPMQVITPQGCGFYCWRADFLAPILEHEWRQVPELAAALDKVQPKDGLVVMSQQQAKLLARFKFNKMISVQLLELGVPRAGDEHGLIGLPPQSKISGIWIERLARRADELIPIKCQGQICRPLFDERGYIIYYRKENFQNDEKFSWIEIKGKRFGVRDFELWRGAIYDPASRIVLIRDGAFH